MKKLLLLLFVVSFAFVSCTDNDNIIPENEKQQIQAIDKNDHPVHGDDEEDVDNE